MGFVRVPEPLPITWRGRPPQILPRDLPTWEEWRAQNEGNWDLVYFNVCLTLREPPTAELTESMLQAWIAAYAKRIDAVVVRGNKGLLIEVTERGNMRSVGQAIVYSLLWEELKPIKGDFRPAILCQWADEDIRFACYVKGIELIELHPIR